MRAVHRTAFTLVELLVVVGVIAVLAAALAPTYISAKQSAMRAVCQSNLSQIQRAFGVYLSDYTECYPNTGSQYLWSGANWRDMIKKYVAAGAVATGEMNRDSVLACPLDPTPSGVYLRTSYAYSSSFYMSPSQVNKVADPSFLRAKFAATNPVLDCATIKTADIRYATKKVIVAEYWTLHCAKRTVGWYDDPATGNDPWSGARNYLFADGHVLFLPTRRIRPAISPLVSRPRDLPDINLTTNGAAGKDLD